VSTETARPTTAHKPDESPIEDVAPTANVEISAVTEAADVTVLETAVQGPPVSTVAQPDPATQ
jgi:hypothetical protein